MAEIPDDVMKAAYDAALDYRNDKACDPIHNDDALQIAFTRAILAERERCCSVLRRMHEQQDGETFDATFLEIEEIIRKGA